MYKRQTQEGIAGGFLKAEQAEPCLCHDVEMMMMKSIISMEWRKKAFEVRKGSILKPGRAEVEEYR